MRFLDKMTNCQNDKLRGEEIKRRIDGRGLWLKPELVKEVGEVERGKHIVVRD